MKCTTVSARLITRAEAKVLGLKRYFTGKVCKRGHIAHRTTLDARCCECGKGFSARHRAANLEATRTKDREYRQRNRERYNEYLAAYRTEKRDIVRAAEKRWRTNNPGRKRALGAKYYLAKKKRIPPWADLQAIRVFYENCPEGYEVDHIHPLQGTRISGLHTIENLQYLPASTNRAKGNRFDQEVYDALCARSPSS